MGVLTATQELSTPVAPSRMFKAYILDSPALFPKVEPDVIKSIEFIEGDGGVGSIQQTLFQEGHEAKPMKHRIDGMDKDNLHCKYTLFEGGPLNDTLVSIEFVVNFEAAGTGTVCKLVKHFHMKEGGMLNVDELIQALENTALEIFNKVEEHLVANPDAYA